MITKKGQEIIGNKPEEKSLGQSLGVGATAGIVAPIGALITQLPANIGLLMASMKQGQHLTDVESDKLIKNMLGKRTDIHVDHLPAPLRMFSHFNPGTKTVHAPKDSYILAHELGHATGLLGRNKTLGRLGSFLTHGLGGPKLAPIISSINSAQKAYNREIGLPENDDSKTLGALNTASQIGTAGQLAEEAQASIRGLNAIGKIQGRSGILRASRVLGPAFGTYALAAAGSHALAPWLGGIIGKRMAKSRLEAEAGLAERDGKR